MSITTRYLFLRLKTNFENEDEAIVDLVANLDSPARIMYLNHQLAWPDGAVVRFHSEESAYELGSRLHEHLRRFELWAIHNAEGDLAEPFGGILGMQLRQLQLFERAATQIFVRYSNRDVDQDDFLAALRREIKEDIRRVFHFRSGCILVLRPGQPSNILIRRFESHILRKYVQCAALIDERDELAVPFRALSWRRLI